MTQDAFRGVCVGWRHWPGLGAALLLAVAAAPRSIPAADNPDPAGIEFFEKKVRPVLIAKCYSCHSVEAKKQKGGLLLDSKAGILKGGDSGKVLVPGKPAESLLLKAIRHQAGDLKMPPKGKLDDNIVTDLEKWIAMGAPDPRDGTVTSSKRIINIEEGRQYWAFKPIVAPGPPPVKNQAWARTPVDRYILARLEAKGLQPNGPVAKEKLIRRAYFDLIGIPPSPAEIDAFLKDTRTDAYERVIDSLLASERYGERWARHWLDAVRFAESGGYEFDGDRPGAYHYRDFVIKAFNQDMPYDRFVRLQLAGDHLAKDDFQANAATGFLVAGPYPGQTTAKTLQIIRYDHLDDMITTVGTSMLGLSLGCARCHEHKYDPIPQEDYYRLIANLARTDSQQAKLDPNPETYRQAKAEFDKVHGPLVAARDKFQAEQLPARVAKWCEQGSKEPPPWLTLDMVSGASTGKTTQFQERADGSVFAAGHPGGNEVYSFTFHTQQKGIKAIRVEALAEPSLPSGGPGRGPDGSFMLTGITLTAAPLKDAKAKAVPVKLTAAAATFEQDKHTVAAALDADKKTGWSVAGQVGKDHAAVFAVEGDLGHESGTVLKLTLAFEAGHFGMGRPRIAIATGPAKLDAPAALQHAQELRTLLDKHQGQINDQNRPLVARWYRGLDPEANKIYAAVEESARQEPQQKLIPAFIATANKGGDVHFLIRGEVDRKNGIQKPGFIQVLMNSPDQDQRWAGPTAATPRVGLANWITDTEQGAGQLLARVIVNRLWQHHMGKGIVGTPNDFGVQGEPPTHPELLDFLAGELIRNGWQLKPIHKLITTSAVYMQSGDANPAAQQADPGNRLWWRRPARRLEAEAIRDALLAVSGSIDLTMYGQGSLDENNLRRSVYLTVKRSRLVPMMQMFDAPEAIQSIGARQTTTVATQALAMMNSPFVRQRAEKFAQRVRPKEAGGLAQAIDDAYLMALGRKPQEAERMRMIDFVQRQLESHGKNPKALDLALSDVCQVLLCSNEFVYVD
jgi:hypothetical protein